MSVIFFNKNLNPRFIASTRNKYILETQKKSKQNLYEPSNSSLSQVSHFNPLKFSRLSQFIIFHFPELFYLFCVLLWSVIETFCVPFFAESDFSFFIVSFVDWDSKILQKSSMKIFYDGHSHDDVLISMIINPKFSYKNHFQ